LGADSATQVASVRTSRGPAVGNDAPEETLWEGRFSPKAMIATWIAMGVVDLVLLGAAIYMLATSIAYWWIPILAAMVFDLIVVARYCFKRIGIRYRLSNHRFFHEEGIFNRKVNPIDLITINDVAFEQGIIERMVGVGRVRIMSSDTTDPELWVVGIEDVQNVATLIDKTRREEMMRRRVFFDASPHG
jgi:uncharacterized membrane protein YdbT with pleckstrin-like domain